jgi:antagonist of KipI
MLTTVQDLGRWGWQSRGVPVAGPMDVWAHRLGNALVGNRPDAATIEVTLVGPEVQFEDERTIAVTGAEFDLTADSRPVPYSAPFGVPAGGTLRFGRRRRGARAYLAVSGGIGVSPVLGSRATHLPSGLGGIDGRPLRAGDMLPLESPAFPPAGSPTGVPRLDLPDHAATVRVLPGPQLGHFPSDALDVLQSAPYVLDAASNRMGFRLRGPSVAHLGTAEMISDATPIGALQIPAGGQPILLMADRQTTGGYPSLATVISADVRLAGQLASGDSISFVVSTLQEAVAAMIEQEQLLLGVESNRGR